MSIVKMEHTTKGIVAFSNLPSFLFLAPRDWW